MLCNMNKVYLLMLCLLSTSFVGCLDTDEDETLEPLGTDENSDSSYESLKNEIKNLDHDAQFRCWGGDLMKGQGCDLVKHYKDHNFMGFLEVIINLKSILKILG